MFEFLKGMGQMASAMKMLPKIREEMEQMNQRMNLLTGEGDAGAGMVKAKVNGKYEVVSLTLSEEAFKLNDREMLEEMIRAAINQAVVRVNEEKAAETSKTMTGLGLPAGFNLPGMG